jgi:hypothetical protein
VHLLVTFQDRAFSQYAQRLKALGTEGRVVLATALNQAGAEVREKTVAAETAQTGLSAGTIDRAQKATEASGSSLTFTIRSAGGDVRLKYFGAKETESGVLAHPFNHNRVFAHTFMSGGRFPNRVTIKRLNGQVIERKGKGRTPTRLVRSGVVIPTEMTKGQTAAAFEAGVGSVIATTIVSKLGTLLP